MSEFKPITGSFIDGIACDIPSNNWGRAEWTAQFDLMKAMGMDTVIIIRVGWLDSAMYQSAVMKTTLYPETDLVRVVFEEADRCGLKVYLGQYDTHTYWPVNDWDTEVRINRDLVDELWDRYGGHRSFHGWYLSHEGRILGQHMARIWIPLIEKMKAHDPAKRILISPRYEGVKYDPPNRAPIPPELHARHLDVVFQEVGALVDEAAFMDGHTLFGQLEEYVKVTAEVCARHNVAFWSNLETFDRDMPWRFPPIEWTKMRFKLEVVQPYVEKIVTFEAPHFLSPLSIYPSAGKLYDRYRDYLRARGVLAVER